MWMKRENRFSANYVQGTSKSRVGVMAWLCIDSLGRSRLVRCPERMNSLGYQNEVLTPNLRFLRATHLQRPIVYMQDGASCHTSASTTRFLNAHRVQVLTPWPAMSPDLNPVEHCWAWLARKMVGKRFPNSNALWEDLQKEWAGRPQNLIPNLYGSMVRRLTAVIVARGGHTRY